ncbi:hypothetical protein LBMAG20_09160 [Methylocystaceae bacterium]|nr:hypothetical protein LBMAG20_09160 [Methylocystaceae bacterium]
MASKKSAINVIVTEGSIKVHYFDRTLTIKIERLDDEAEDNSNLFIKLDEIEYWDAPDNIKTISIVELQKILNAIESYAEKNSTIIEFE